MNTRFWLVTGAFILSGCNGNITDYVKGVDLPNIRQPRSDPAPSNGPMSLKVSPGALTGTTTNAALKATVTTTDHLYPAGDISARLTISRTRISP